MKVLGLIEKDLDVVSKEYVDNKIKNYASAEDVNEIKTSLEGVDDFLKSINKNLGGN
ncbi:hypothetical protein [Peptostreptococcus stomatis]|jgi:hypothetical protein|uniref:Uncharacterized protein n=1 Tax=Peptostreptococcus stomatis DSM 17678 TaxID=596315 RepID=E0E212_9FIRM|nr:hypothetical protein [Peptostreptococcus stomatis]EFM65068.1 hypothetical protein HMPREF0634_0230 [Peptostreptococcus stomatis DSM 17678]